MYLFLFSPRIHAATSNANNINNKIQKGLNVKQEIIAQVNAFFIQTLDMDAACVVPEAELKRDMGITSVDAVAIASFVQKTFDCTIRRSDIRYILTLQDLYDYIEKNGTW